MQKKKNNEIFAKEAVFKREKKIRLAIDNITRIQ